MSESKFKEMEETHSQGIISIENIPEDLMQKGDLGIQISPNGKVWICINGIAFLRFNPVSKDYLKGEKL